MNITVKKLNKSYGQTKVFNNFSMELPVGSITNIMGPSGCGKTTLMRMLLGLEKPDSGQISGVPTKLAALFQEDRLCPQLGAVDNIRLVTAHRLGKTEIERELRSLGIDDDLYKPTEQFSGGMQRRVALARAMLADADMILLDEPFKGLDERTKSAAIDYVLARLNGRTVLHITHSTDDAAQLGGTVINLGK